MKDLTGGSTIPIAALGSDVGTVRWSPDGSSIIFAGTDSSGKIVRSMFPRLGGTPRPLPGSRSDTTAGWYAVLSPDGSRLAAWYAFSEAPIVITTLESGTTRRVDIPDSLGFPDEGDWSPTGRSIALLSYAKTGTRWTLSSVDLGTGDWHTVVSDSVPLSPPRWSHAGDALYYLRDSNELYRIPLTPVGVPRGAPEPLQTGMGASDLSITGDGRLAYTKVQGHSNLWLAKRSGRKGPFRTIQLSRGTVSKSGGRFSPDGRLISFVQREAGRGDVFVLPTKGGTPRRVTASGVAAIAAPAWSQKGDRLAFVVTLRGRNRVRTVSIEGSEERTYEDTEVGESGDLAWAPQDRILYQGSGNRNFHWLDPSTAAEQSLVANDSVGWMFRPLPSPDERGVAVFWNRRDAPRGAYLISPQDNSQKLLGMPGFFWPMGWSSKGTSLYVEDQSRQIHKVPVRGGEGVIIGTIPFKNQSCELREAGPEELDLLCVVNEFISDVWMMNFESAHRR